MIVITIIAADITSAPSSASPKPSTLISAWQRVVGQQQRRGVDEEHEQEADRKREREPQRRDQRRQQRVDDPDHERAGERRARAFEPDSRNEAGGDVQGRGGNGPGEKQLPEPDARHRRLPAGVLAEGGTQRPS